jgi:hypothetical protein
MRPSEPRGARTSAVVPYPAAQPSSWDRRGPRVLVELVGHARKDDQP